MMKRNLMHSLLAAFVLGASVLVVGGPCFGQGAESLDGQKQHAWRLYGQYKASAAALERAESRLNDLRSQVHEAAGGGAIGGGAYLAQSGMAAEMSQLSEIIAALKSRLSELRASWEGAGLTLPFGPLSDALRPESDPETGAPTDRTARRLSYTPGRPKETRKSAWALRPPPEIYCSQKDNLADYSKQSGSAAHGSISAREEVSLDRTKPPEIVSGALTWSFTNRTNLDTLVPGETLKWTATVRDTAGTGRVMGCLKFEVYGTGGKFTSDSPDIFYESPPDGGALTRSGVAIVPNGKPGDKILLRGKVVAGRCTMACDEVYEMR